MTLDASDEQLVRVSFGILDKVGRSLLGGDGNEGHTLVGGLEPDDLGALNRTTRFIALVTLALTTLGLLFLLGRRRRGAKETQSTREQLTGHTLDDGDDMASKLWLDVISDPTEMGEQTPFGCNNARRTPRPRTASNLGPQLPHHPSSCRSCERRCP